ncbi:hypothetical protein [Geodermatophilus sp. SYSU D01119]
MIDPTAAIPANIGGDYGSVPSDRRAQQQQAAELAEARTDFARSFDGRPAVYRLGFAGMQIKGLPDYFQSGRVIVAQAVGPVNSQTTYIVQRPGWVPVFDKTMHRGPVILGEGLHLTICHLKVIVPAEEHVGLSLELWRDEALAAIAVVAAMLDDRVAQQEVFEDLMVFDASGQTPMGMLDTAVRIRDFAPTKAVTRAQAQGLQKLANWDSSAQTSTHVAARWYLKATQAGPTPDAIVYLWIALEALIPAKGRGKSSDVKGVEDALTQAGADPTTWVPSIGRCAGIRADIVHHGQEQPELLSEGFYALETAVRIILRHRLDIQAESWPPEVGQTNLRLPFQKLADRLKAQARVTMRLVQDKTDDPTS